MTNHETAAFDVAAAILAIVADPVKAKARLAEQRAASENLAQREAKLVAAREAFDAECKRVRDEFEVQSESIRRRWQLVSDERSKPFMIQRLEEAEREAENAR